MKKELAWYVTYIDAEGNTIGQHFNRKWPLMNCITELLKQQITFTVKTIQHNEKKQ